MNIQKDWYVVQTKPFQEEKVIFYLRQSGINIYFPKTQTYIYKNFKRYKKIKLLFPGYIFVKCKRKKLYQVCWTRGVKKVLWENTKPQPVSEELISSIKSLESKDGLIKPQNFKKNELVRIKSGPFKDILALFDHWESDKERACLLLSLINGQVKITLPASLVETA